MAAPPSSARLRYERLLAGQVESAQGADAPRDIPRSGKNIVPPIKPESVSDGTELPAQAITNLTNEAIRWQPSVAASKPLDSPIREGLTFLGPPQAIGELGRFGPYPVLRELGNGGMGMVFLVEDPRLGRRVALKVMRPTLAASAQARQRFLREARAGASLTHDNIVPVYHSGEEAGLPFLLMPLLHGETLENLLRREGRLSNDAVLRLGREVAAALAHAHERGLVHRDVKPGNIWIEAGTGRAKVLDFGLVRVADEAGALTQPGALLGTPSYMAPEQIDPEAGHPLDHRCDLFALGCILYRASTGVLPFQGTTVRSIFRAVLSDNVSPPHVLNPSLPTPVNDLILQLLAKQPERRPLNAAAVVASLRAPRRLPLMRHRKIGTNAWLAVLAVVSLGAVGFYLRSTTLKPALGNEKGTLVIVSGEGRGAVRFSGDWTRVADPSSTREFELRAGESEIEVRELPNGSSFFTKEFVLRAEGKIVIDVRFEPAKRP